MGPKINIMGPNGAQKHYNGATFLFRELSDVDSQTLVGMNMTKGCAVAAMPWPARETQ